MLRQKEKERRKEGRTDFVYRESGKYAIILPVTKLWSGIGRRAPPFIIYNAIRQLFSTFFISQHHT